jgi:hypothetical protein
MDEVSRREFLKRAGAAAVVFGAVPIAACASMPVNPLMDPPTPEDQNRLTSWVNSLSPGGQRFKGSLNGAAAAVGVMAIGTPYEAFTLEKYLKAGGDASATEPLALSLTKFDCVTLVESSLGVARLAAHSAQPFWELFGREVERMRYRGGVRRGFASRLHYFSEWISDGQKRGLVHDLAKELGGINDTRPLRFMTEHRASYPGLATDKVFGEIAAMERSLDFNPRYVIPTDRIASISDKLESGDVLAFATSIPGLDVSHAAFAYRDSDGVMRVLHAPLSGGSVEISKRTLSDYVAAIKRSTGIMVARPLG